MLLYIYIFFFIEKEMLQGEPWSSSGDIKMYKIINNIQGEMNIFISFDVPDCPVYLVIDSVTHCLPHPEARQVYGPFVYKYRYAPWH